MNKYKITIFTPTYNRRVLLERLYESIKIQKFKSFEWIIVDDGSIDDTEAFVTRIVKEASVDIVYKKVENGGKHRAINLALEIARGELFYIVDSDDFLVKNCLARIDKLYEEIKNNEEFIGLSGTCISNNEMLGSFPDKESVDCTSLERSIYGILGDQAEVFKTCILKKYKFPEYEGEKFLSEAVIWNKIAADGYKIRWYKESFMKIEYQQEGLTSQLNSHLRRSPIGFADYIYANTAYGNVSLIKKITWYYIYYKIMSVDERYTIKKCSEMLKINTGYMAMVVLLGKTKAIFNKILFTKHKSK